MNNDIWKDILGVSTQSIHGVVSRDKGCENKKDTNIIIMYCVMLKCKEEDQGKKGEHEGFFHSSQT